MKEITDKLKEYIGVMESTFEWQVGFVFKIYENKAGAELNKLEVIEHPDYEIYRSVYSNLITRAKLSGLI
jgi:hypothetical protein